MTPPPNPSPLPERESERAEALEWAHPDNSHDTEIEEIVARALLAAEAERQESERQLRQWQERVVAERERADRLAERLREVESMVRDVIYGLRRQPEITREQIADAIENDLDRLHPEPPAEQAEERGEVEVRGASE